MELTYIKDKDCKGSVRFTPEDHTVIGRSPIYIDKDKLDALGIDPEKGFEMHIEPK